MVTISPKKTSGPTFDSGGSFNSGGSFRRGACMGAVLTFILGVTWQALVSPDLANCASSLLADSTSTSVTSESTTTTSSISSASSSSSTSSSTDSFALLSLPAQTKHVVLNIGTNVDPLLPQQRHGACARVIAFEPIVPYLIPKHPQVMVVPAAVSNSSSLASMFIYNTGAVSSSLSKPNKEGQAWNNQPGEPHIVPVVTMTQVIRSIPQDVEIVMLDTDMQGYDATAVKSAIAEIRDRKVKYLKTETSIHNTDYSYQGVDNEFCTQWLPMMTQHGYELVGVEVGGSDRTAFPGYQSTALATVSCQKGEGGGYQEMDALWVLRSAFDTTPTLQDPEIAQAFEYHKLQGEPANPFTQADYDACHQA